MNLGAYQDILSGECTIPVHPVVAHLGPGAEQDYFELYRKACTKAYERKGDIAFEHSRESAAIHEAGHVVLCKLDDFGVAWARIWRDKEHKSAWCGWTEGIGEDMQLGTAATPESNLRGARQIMAGYISERVFEGEDAREGSSVDERAACMFPIVWAARALGRNPMDVLKATEEQLTGMLERNTDTAQAIAKALIKATPMKLKGAKLNSLVAKVHL